MIDLHIHTNISDGMLSPQEVIDEAVKNRVSVIAIADHDTIEAYNDELYNHAKEKNIQIINAVEISTKIDRAGIHVLGYNVDINQKELKEKLYELRNARHIYLHAVAIKLNELGYVLNAEELDKIDSVTKAHIARDIIGNKENEKLLLQNFGYVPDMGEFIETVMNEGCPAYVRKSTINPKEAAELIRKAGGKVVLAHPVAYKYEDNLADEEVLEIVNEMKPDGIEAYYIYFDRNNNKINEIEKWKAFAKENNLFVTIGSDFHSKDGKREIGLINDDIELSNEDIERMNDDLIS
ncbi:MAG: PHP domain-containing protein [Clostridia bacterium]|nr:PHP domain-containing protein [Clostridia bacterium]